MNNTTHTQPNAGPATQGHTPGPWHPDLSLDAGTTWDIVDERGLGAIIATIPAHDPDDGPAPTTPEEDAANARLIAAAPELLRVLEHIAANPSIPADLCYLRQIEAAIRQAKGTNCLKCELNRKFGRGPCAQHEKGAQP